MAKLASWLIGSLISWPASLGFAQPAAREKGAPEAVPRWLLPDPHIKHARWLICCRRNTAVGCDDEGRHIVRDCEVDMDKGRGRGNNSNRSRGYNHVDG